MLELDWAQTAFPAGVTDFKDRAPELEGQAGISIQPRALKEKFESRGG